MVTVMDQQAWSIRRRSAPVHSQRARVPPVQSESGSPDKKTRWPEPLVKATDASSNDPGVATSNTAPFYERFL